MDQPGAQTFTDTEIRHARAVERAILAMHHHLDHAYTLEEIASEVFISPFHFSRIFRRQVGLPPGHFLSALRIQAAKRMLLGTDAKVIDVCFEVGFSSVGTFSRRFKDLVGVSPRRLRIAAAAQPRPPQRPLVLLPPLAGRALGELTGRVTAPGDFRGSVFVGLFETPLPQGRPVACAMLGSAGGELRLQGVPDGSYYLFAAGFPEGERAEGLEIGDGALRAGSPRRPIRVRNGRAQRPLSLALRPARLTDPPILISLPCLLDRLKSSPPAAPGDR